MENIHLKKLWPYLAAIVFFVLLGLIYFSPVLDGKKMKQGDIAQFRGMSKEVVDYRESTGKEALWTNSMFGGMPAYQISVIYKGVLVRYVDKMLKLGLPHPINLMFLYFLGFFILMLVLRVNPWLAVLGSVGFAFSSYFFIIFEAGHNSKAHAIGYMAPVLAGIILSYRGKYLWGAALTALFLSLELFTNHLQITYYLLLTAGIFVIYQLVENIREKQLPHFAKATGVLVVAAMLAVLVNISNIWATWEYGKYTIRGKTELTSEKENRTSGLDKDYATMWSYGVSETFTLLVPDFMGGGSQQVPDTKSHIYKEMVSQGIPQGQAVQYLQYFSLYWGTQPGTSGPVYVGAIIMFLFILGLFVVKGKLKWWLLTATMLSILLAWGHNFMAFTEFFMHYIPGYNKFRAVSMTLVIAELTIPILGILALKQIFDPETDKKAAFKKITYAFYITGGLAVFLAVFAGMFFQFSGRMDSQLVNAGFPAELIEALRLDRKATLQTDAVRSFIFITLAAVAIWAALFNKIKKDYAFIGLIVLVTIDMWGVNHRYVNSENFETARKVENPFQPTAADQMILKDKDPNFRVMNTTVSTFNDASTSYFHKSIGGYHGAKFRRYQELIDEHISQNNMNVLNMLNTKYFIVKGANNQPEARQNPGAMGNAWIVENYDVAQNADEEIKALPSFDPSTTAIIDNRFQDFLTGYQPGKGSSATIELTSYQPNQLKYHFESSKNELVVFSEIYYDKGWKAFIDGKEAPYFRANYILRAMVVPAGNHEIVWKFEPKVYYAGGNISLIASLLVILIFIGAMGIELKVPFLKKYFK